MDSQCLVVIQEVFTWDGVEKLLTNQNQEEK